MVFKRLVILGFGCAALASCSPGAEPAEKADQAARAASTIVSLNPCADGILAQLTGPDQVLAISHYSHNPAASSMTPELAAQYRSTSGTAEEILALAPDVVVADIFLAPATRSALERSGIRVETIGIAETLEGSLDQIAQLAQLAGKDEQGRMLAGTIQAAWDAAYYRGEAVDTLLWQEGGLVPGEGTLVAAMLKQTGFSLQSAARGMGQGAYLPLEQVLADPPQLVLAASEARMQTHPVLRKQKGIAYRYFEPSLLYCGGPTIIRALDRLRSIREDFDREGVD